MDYKKLAQKALNEAKAPKKKVNENISYAEGHMERMDPRLERELRDRKHSLGDHPIFPAGDEKTFEQKIMAARFEEVMKNYKGKFDVETINNDEVKYIQAPLLKDCMAIEAKHKKALEELAVKMVQEEFNIPEGVVDFTAELTEDISLEGTRKEKLPTLVEVEFDDHDSIEMANKHVYKRRFLNAMTQGMPMRTLNMFHLVQEELSAMDPRLTPKYGKLMAAADYCYFVEPDMHEVVGQTDTPKGMVGGIVEVDLPSDESPNCHVRAQAKTFPVLVHELCKGVMEIFSVGGLPEDEKIAEFVVGKADFLAAEPWDMRLGPALWLRFVNLFRPEHMKLKYNVYSELAALPVDEFNIKMREIMANTKAGQQIINDMCEACEKRIQEDAYRDEIGDDDSDGFSLNDLDDIDINDLY